MTATRTQPDGGPPCRLSCRSSKTCGWTSPPPTSTRRRRPPRSWPTRTGRASCGCSATGRVCVCEMAAALGARENNVSNHLARLRDAGLVRASRPGGRHAARLLRARRRGLPRAPSTRSREVARMTTPRSGAPGSRSGHGVAAAPRSGSSPGSSNLPAANWVAFDLLGLERGSHLGDAVAFFLYDVPKVLLLLLGIVTVGLLPALLRPARSGCAPRWRAAARSRRPSAAAALRRRHAVLLVLGRPALHRLRRGRRPARASPSPSSISSPMVNEVALVLLWGLFGPGVALLYMGAGLAVAIVGGLVHRAPAAWSGTSRTTSSKIRAGGGATSLDIRLSVEQRVRDAWRSTKDIVRQGPALRARRDRDRRAHPWLRPDGARRLGRRSRQPARGPARRRPRRSRSTPTRPARSRSSRR